MPQDSHPSTVTLTQILVGEMATGNIPISFEVIMEYLSVAHIEYKMATGKLTLANGLIDQLTQSQQQQMLDIKSDLELSSAVPFPVQLPMRPRQTNWGGARCNRTSCGVLLPRLNGSAPSSSLALRCLVMSALRRGHETYLMLPFFSFGWSMYYWIT